jgi:coatomer subunit alpha
MLSLVCCEHYGQIVEKAYQQTKNFDRLSFLYLATGSTDKLIKMQKIAEARGDPMSRFHNALYAGDVRSRIAVLREVGLRTVFSACAGCNGFTDAFYLRPSCLFDSQDK